MYVENEISSCLQEVLFHELHHRFYNSLQLVSSMLGTLASDHKQPEEIRLLQDRIGMLGGLHRTLSKPLVDVPDMQAAFTTLCASLTHGFARDDVTLNVEAAVLPNDPLIVRGLTLILVELVTNALKHGGSQKARIGVVISATSGGCRLTVSSEADFRSNFADATPRVATRFAQAMGGTLTVASGREHVVCVTVPTREPFIITAGETS
jgi:two-component sensor histidine kinase